MASPQDTGFAKIAGQLVASGTGTNMPVTALGANDITNTNIANVNGMLQTVKDVFFRETRVFNGNNLDRYFTKWTQRFGGPVEEVFQGYLAPQQKLDGTCMPRGNPPIMSNVYAINYAYSVDVTIPDYMYDMNVLDENMLGSLVAARTQTAAARIAWSKYLAEKQVISNVIDGTRTIDSTTSTYDGGASVSYNPNVKGYAGVVDTSLTAVVPEVKRGSLVTGITVQNALDMLYLLQGYAADMDIPDSDMNQTGVDAQFVMSKPILIAETKVLNALDNAFRNPDAANNAAVMGTSFRNLCGEFSEICEIDSFASLPTNSQYENKRLGFVLLDRDAPVERIVRNSVESFRCAKERATGINWQGESSLFVSKGLDSAAVLFSTQA